MHETVLDDAGDALVARVRVRAEIGDRVLAEFTLAVANQREDAVADSLLVGVDLVGDDDRRRFASGRSRRRR
jgi:hypothetical protein